MQLIFYTISLILLFSQECFSQDKIDWASYRGNTGLFSSSQQNKIEKNPSLLSQEDELKINFLTLDIGTNSNTLNLIKDLNKTIGAGEYNNFFSPFFSNSLMGIGRANFGFMYKNFGLSAFFNSEAKAKLDNPVFPTARSISFGETGLLLGYGRDVYKNLSIGFSTKFALVKGIEFYADSMDLLRRELLLNKFNGSYINSNIALTYNANFSPNNKYPILDILNGNTFSMGINNIAILKNSLEDTIPSPEVSLGVKRKINIYKTQDISAYGQADFSEKRPTLSVGAEYFPISNFGVALGLSDLELTGGIKTNLSIFSLSLGTYSRQLDALSKERVYSFGLSINSN